MCGIKSKSDLILKSCEECWIWHWEKSWFAVGMVWKPNISNASWKKKNEQLMLRTCNFQIFISNNSLKCLCVLSAISAVPLGWNNTSPAYFTLPQRKRRVAEIKSTGKTWLCVGCQPWCVRGFNSTNVPGYNPTLCSGLTVLLLIAGAHL